MPEGRLAKPQLRDLHLTRVKRNLGVMAVLAASVCIAFKTLVINPYERKVEEFYKNYDPMKALDVMNKAGLMESYPLE